MLKRLLLSAATGFGVWFLFLGIIFILVEFGFEFDKTVAGSTTNGLIMAGCAIVIALVSPVIVFMKVQTKNTIVEDIIVNKVKIIKSEQEEKLKSLNK